MYSVLLDDKIAQDNTCHTTTFVLQYLRDVLGLCGQIVNVRFKSKAQLVFLVVNERGKRYDKLGRNNKKSNYEWRIASGYDI